MPDPIAQGEIKDSFTLIFSVIAERKVKISAIRKTADMSDMPAFAITTRIASNSINSPITIIEMIQT